MPTIRLRRGTTAEWARINPVLDAGEPGLEIDTLSVKYGDGDRRWLDLPYSARGDVNGVPDSSGLQAHINSPNPHPAYDDLISLAVLYENAKV